MRTRYKYDADLDCLVEIGGNSNYFEEKTESANVISDNVGAGVNGLRHLPSGKMLDSKSAHRKETKARGLEEVGNDRMASQKQSHQAVEYVQMVNDAQQQIASNWNGTADWLKNQRNNR